MPDSRGYIVDFLFCCAIGVLAMLPVLFEPGLPASWDFGAHVAPSAKLALWLKQGVYPLQFPEFWFGYPLLVFYPPLFYLSVAATSVVFAIDVYVSTKVILAISFVMGAFGAYFAARSGFGTRTPSLVAAVGYTFAGYHLRNIISQGVYPASFSFMFLPWVLAFWYLSLKRKKAKFLILAGVFLALSILSHLITGLLTAASFILASLVLSVSDLATANVRRIAERLVSTSAIVVVAIGLSAWFLIPMSKHLASTYLASGLIGPAQDRGFPLDPDTFIRRNLPFDDLIIRRPIDFAAGELLPFYIGTVLIALAMVGLGVLTKKSVRALSKQPIRIGQLADFVGFSALVFAGAVIFSTNVQLFVLPLWWLSQPLAVSLMRIQHPTRLLFLVPLGASMMSGYAVFAFFRSGVEEKLRATSQRINLDLNLSKLAVVLLIGLMILDTRSYAASPYGYYASYPPYSSEGLDSAYRWLAFQPGRFRVVDPLAGVHSHVMSWDTLSFPGGWSMNPEYYPYSPKNYRTLNITNQLPQNFARELGYFGVRYAIGHLANPSRDGAGFEGTNWYPIKKFSEVYMFENPLFRPIVEVVKDPNDLDSSTMGSAVIDSYAPNRIIVSLSSVQSAGFLVLKFFKQPQWRANVDGTFVDPLESDWGFMFVSVNSDTKQVVFSFGELDLVGASITSSTILVIVAWLFFSRTRKRRAFAAGVVSRRPS